MNEIRKIIIVVFLFLVLLSVIYVPWVVDFKIDFYSTRINHGYSFIFSPPSQNARIDFSRVFLTILAITSFTAIFYIIFTIISKRYDNTITDNKVKYVNNINEGIPDVPERYPLKCYREFLLYANQISEDELQNIFDNEDISFDEFFSINPNTLIPFWLPSVNPILGERLSIKKQLDIILNNIEEDYSTKYLMDLSKEERMKAIARTLTRLFYQSQDGDYGLFR